MGGVDVRGIVTVRAWPVQERFGVGDWQDGVLLLLFHANVALPRGGAVGWENG